MLALLISLAIFIAACASLHAGRSIAARMPQVHLTYEAQKSAQFGIGMMATLMALVLGFMVTSARATFDRANEDVIAVATNLVLADRALSGYGEQAQPMRVQLRHFLDTAASGLEADDKTRGVIFRTPHTNLSLITQLQGNILTLEPHSDAQLWFRGRALQLTTDLAHARVLTSEDGHSSEPVPLLCAIGVWVVLIFIGIGIYSTHNRAVMVVMLFCALAYAGAIFLILELEDPYGGILRVSGEPLLHATAELKL
ncbi:MULTISPECIES: hypothetical protein [Dyella]|uniref:DUF4239 domain-containing protein n=2 Tax=Dyella TaxID=231454 RepID=A0A4R0YPP3_9GAMM|nr:MULTISPECIES: hypothetical protein [Dyella]TBR37157.1 hypothetical protein EYV96_14840 [Dyella terrae]TCI07753.1 hypothetical protein EZM97_24030 [Dyella soli]